MAAADQDTFWLRLTEEWGAWADAALYQELETERKRWLLSALYSINRLPDTGLVQTSTAERRILAFFESQGTSSVDYPVLSSRSLCCLLSLSSNCFVYRSSQCQRSSLSHGAEPLVKQAVPQHGLHAGQRPHFVHFSLHHTTQV